MKKILSLLTLSLFIGLCVLNAQNPRTVVLECFTSATCGPCAQYNPALDNLINNNADNLIAIKYHVNWPSPSNDPMNQHNPSEVSSRVSYYNVSTVPQSVADGNVWNGNSGNVTQAMIDQWAAVESPLEMRMTHYLNDTQDTITVIVMGKASSAISSDNLKLHIVVLEKTMEYATAPGTNNERIFHNVMKKMLPGSSGTKINAMQAGDYFAYEYSWALANVMDVNELTAVAWVQDNTNKHIIQGCKSAEDFQPFYAKQAQITGIDHTKQHICSGIVEPDIYVTNYGSETINSLSINVSMNGNILSQISWQGNIPFGEQDNISLGELAVEVSENNEILIQIDQINGAADDYAPSVYSYVFDETMLIVNKSLKVLIRTDDDPQSITWEVVNTATGDIIINGGPYDTPHKKYTTNFDIDEDGCYMLTVYDAGGNGLTSGSGLYALQAGNTTVISGVDFTDKVSDEFSYSTYANVTEYAANTAKVYPNPTNGMLTIDTEESGLAEIYNMAGQMILNQKIEGLTVLNLSELEKGTYLLVVTDNDGGTSRQVIVLQ